MRNESRLHWLTRVEESLSSILHYACHIPCRDCTEAGVIPSKFCTLIVARKREQLKIVVDTKEMLLCVSKQPFQSTQLPVFGDFWRNYWNLFRESQTHRHLQQRHSSPSQSNPRWWSTAICASFFSQPTNIQCVKSDTFADTNNNF